MTTRTRDAGRRPFTPRLLDVVRCFAGHDLDARSLHGIGHATGRLPAPVPALPGFLLGWLEAGDGVRVAALPTSGGRLRVAWVSWRLGDQFDAASGWRHRVPDADHARVREALAAVAIRPAWLIDAGPEVVALWPLTQPIPVDREPRRAVALLERLATRLGAEIETARGRSATLPLCGIIRNWNTTPPDRVELVDVAPGATSTVEDLEQTLEPGDRP